jgi:hypothetical protein
MPTGHSSSFTFGASAVTLDIISIDPPEESTEDVALPHLGLDEGAYIPYEPGDLVEGGEYSIEMANDMDSDIPIGTVETMTWTKPLQTGDTTAANWSFSGYIKSVKENAFETSQRATITVVVKVAGEVTKNAAS